jgi:polyisoprenoid-binding protein YceI
MKRFIFSIALVTALAAPGLAVAQNWTIDTVHSNVTFKVRHLFTKVSGEFNDFAGTITFDPAQPEQAKVEAVIQVASIDTKNEKRDGHLKSGDFFAVDEFPEITFKTTKVTPDGDKLQVTGDLTMRGVTKPVILEVEFLGAGPHPMMDGGMVAGFTATTTINRKDFDISWNKVLDNGGALLGDEVEIALEVEAVQSKDEAQAR